MLLHQATYQNLIKLIKKNFSNEITYYTHPNVQTTAQAVGAADLESWALVFKKNQIIHALPKKGDRFVELERTVTAIYCYLLTQQSFPEVYPAFIAAQVESTELQKADILTEESYKNIYERTKKIIDTKDKQIVLLYLITYSDLGKSPKTKELIKEVAKKYQLKINLALDPDDLMAEILRKFSDEQVAEILPSFSQLSTAAKKMCRELYPIMQACFGHIYFLERGKKTYEVVGKALLNIPCARHAQALDIVYLAQFYDGIGAQGQCKITGSLTCTENFAKGYDLIYQSLKNFLYLLNLTQKVEDAAHFAFEDYLKKRAKWMGFPSPLSPAQKFCTRLGGVLRCFTPAIGNIIWTEFQKLPQHYQQLLINQLGFENQGLESWTKVNYVASIPQNVSRELFAQGKTQQAIIKALNSAICFALLIREIAESFHQIVVDETRSLSFGEVAYLATKMPTLFTPEKFNAKDYILDETQNKIVQGKGKYVFLPPTSLLTNGLLVAASLNALALTQRFFTIPKPETHEKAPMRSPLRSKL